MGGLPQFISFGEALTDLIRRGEDSWVSVPGGAPWNVARVMACFGVSSAFGGAIGRDCFSDVLYRASEQAGLDLRFLQRPDKSPLLAIVHETHPPKYFFVGDDSADLHFDVSAMPEGWERAVRWAHFGCISLARQPLGDRLVGLAESLHASGVRISYDPNYRATMDERYDPTLARMMAIADIFEALTAWDRPQPITVRGLPDETWHRLERERETPPPESAQGDLEDLLGTAQPAPAGPANGVRPARRGPRMISRGIG